MGHYVAYSKRQGDWFLFDDESVKRVSEQDALNDEAYLLFYRKIES